MASHDVFVLPSEAEGLPLALLESMSAGLVPVASDLPGGVREVVIPGDTGLLPPVGDIAGFAEAISGLATNRTRLEQLGRAARQKILDSYDVREQAARYEELYLDCAKLRRVKPRGKLLYGSRLDRPWIPNPLVRFIRARTRPDLRSLLREQAMGPNRS
jgi:glycogen synthase